MAKTTGHKRVCPTRIDAAAALFAHRVTTSQCLDRQRGLYHKCFTCAHNNAYVAAHGPHMDLPLVARTRAQKLLIDPLELAVELEDIGEPVAPVAQDEPLVANGDVGLRAV
jgi:hypothetical protein